MANAVKSKSEARVRAERVSKKLAEKPSAEWKHQLCETMLEMSKTALELFDAFEAADSKHVVVQNSTLERVSRLARQMQVLDAEFRQYR